MATEPQSERFTSEQLVLVRDDSVGLRAAIAIDDTTLGPGLGGVRMKPYPSEDAVITEAQRLGAAMTLKNAFAELPYGGAKSVILAPPKDTSTEQRDALLRRFGEFVRRTGAYLPGVDMGTSVRDLAVIGDSGAEVSCSTEDPSPVTALGVSAAVRAAIAHVDRRSGVDGVTVLIQGAGHVGHALALDLAKDGARILVADIDAERAMAVAEEVGGAVVPPEHVIGASCDVYAPCSVARVISPATIERLNCRIVAGAANDTLTAAADAEALLAREITYVPDFVANAGGVIDIHALRAGWSSEVLRSHVLQIGDRTEELLAAAESSGRSPLAVATTMVHEKLAKARAETEGRPHTQLVAA
jgi:leucine dehydrogenase